MKFPSTNKNILEHMKYVSNSNISSSIKTSNNPNQFIKDTTLKVLTFNALLNLYKKHTNIELPESKKLFTDELVNNRTVAFMLKEFGVAENQSENYISNTGLNLHSINKNLDIFQTIENDTILLFKELKKISIEPSEKVNFLENSTKNNSEALSDFAHLRMNLKYLNNKTDKSQDSSSLFKTLEEQLSSNDINIDSVKTLLNNNQFSSPEKAKGTPLSFSEKFNSKIPINEQNVLNAVDEGKVWVRAIINPHLKYADTTKRGNRLFQKRLTLSERSALLRGTKDHYGELEQRRLKRRETGAQIEFRKIFRDKGIPTLAKESKTDRLEKYGNQKRPVSKIDFGYPSFDEIGYGIIKNSDNKTSYLDDIQKVSNFSIDSGFGKMLKQIQKNPNQEIEENLKHLDEHLKKGAFSSDKKTMGEKFNETIMNINKDDVKFVFFYEGDTYKKTSLNRSQKQLLAIYTSKTYKSEAKKAFDHLNKSIKNESFGYKNIILKDYENLSKKDLPIFQYSPNAMYPRIKEYSNENIVELAKNDFSDFMKEHLEAFPKINHFSDFENTKFFSSTIIAKYMDNDYIKILDTDLKRNIKNNLKPLNKSFSQEFLDNAIKKDIFSFEILNSLDKLGCNLNASPTLKESTKKHSLIILEKLNNKRYIHSSELNAFKEIVNSAKSHDYFHKETLNNITSQLHPSAFFKIRNAFGMGW